MKLKVDKKEIKNVEKELLTKSEQLALEFETWTKNIEDLKTIWQGPETEPFYRSIDDYLARIKLIPETSKAIGNFMVKSTNAYEEKEEEFRDQLKKENDLYEESDVNKGLQSIPTNNQQLDGFVIEDKGID